MISCNYAVLWVWCDAISDVVRYKALTATQDAMGINHIHSEN
jgi:hypothetical protein